MFKRLKTSIRIRGVFGLLTAILRRLIFQKAKSHPDAVRLLTGKYGLEIGGVSNNFSDEGILPVYSVVHQLDNVNFGQLTLWEEVTDGQYFKFHPKAKPGYQYVAESSDLSMIESEKYDFLISNHSIEHMANPIKCMEEWIRVLKDNGILVVIFPHKEGTFDRYRPVTQLSHLIEDYENNIGEEDLTHIAEIIELTDLWRDPDAGSRLDFEKRLEENYENRGAHHHVFDNQLVADLINHMGLQCISLESYAHNNIIVIAKKIPLTEKPNNDVFVGIKRRLLHRYRVSQMP